MARSRNIKPGFFLNDLLAEVDPLGRLLFAGLWTIADREGRIEDRPKRIKAEILPYDNCDVVELLDELNDRKFIMRYQVNGGKYIQITGWNKHQNPHVKEKASTIPAPDLSSASIVQAQQDNKQEKNSFGSGDDKEKKTKKDKLADSDEMDGGEIFENNKSAKSCINKGISEELDKHHTSPVQEPEKHTINLADSFNLIPDSLNLIPDSFNLVSGSKEDEDDLLAHKESSLKKIEEQYIQNQIIGRGVGVIPNPKDYESMKNLLKAKIPLEDILSGIDQAFKNFKPKHPKDRINSFAYCESVILDQHAKKLARENTNRESVNYDGFSQSIGSNTQSTEQSKGKWDHLVYRG
ncbi:hypothetical protein [Shimazuella kribbensis]|uniref:hypothetical protein n=1 Tax=Shimazuella kribbensis TaxID=139808 RepID=UPI00040D9E23|nr:hypothetical protein [Shimazuella kribbensis]